jgi:hypothetical protein
MVGGGHDGEVRTGQYVVLLPLAGTRWQRHHQLLSSLPSVQLPPHYSGIVGWASVAALLTTLCDSPLATVLYRGASWSHYKICKGLVLLVNICPNDLLRVQ